jgi:hypothetical protein
VSGEVTARLPSGKRVRLSAHAFVAAGGEGSIYARGDVAYKIYDDPARAIAAGKIAELARIAHPAVLTPRELLHSEDGGAPIGYAMKFLPSAWTLAELVPSAFWKRHGLGPADAQAIAVRLHDAIAAVHAAGCCVGDLSAANVLVERGSLRPHLVDTDSFQTPRFSATAITPEIRDPRARGGRFDAGSDWFAFAVLAFELFTGLHPFKGRHPTVKGMTARMDAGISALQDEVRKPAAWRGLSGVPAAWVEWFRAVLEGSTRAAPTFTFATTTPSSVGLEVVGRLLDGSSLSVCIDRAAGVVRLSGTRAVVPAAISIVPVAMIVHRGHVILHVDDRLVRLDPVVVGERVFVGMVPIASVMPHATRLWPGLAISDVVGRAHAHLFDANAGVRTVRVPALDGAALVEAAYEDGKIALVVRDRSRLRRLVLAVGPDDRVALAATAHSGPT